MRAEVGLGFQADKSPGAYAELGQLAERHGFDVLTVYADLMYQSPIAALLEMAAATTRVRLGVSCWNPYTMHPYEIAGQLAALDAASNGRAFLGLARGSWLGDVGITQTRPVTYLGECAEVVYRLLGADARGYRGEVFTLAPGAKLRYPVRRARPPLLIGTWGPRTAALAGRIADEVKIGGTTNADMIAVMRARIATGCRHVNRAPDDVGIVVGAVSVVDTDARAARARARREVALYLPVVATLDPTLEIPESLLNTLKSAQAEGSVDDAAAAIPDQLLDRFAFAGDPDHVAARAQALIDAGASRVEFGTPHGLDDRRGVELLATSVIPQLRR
jgi:5,10-methylenetetrahydromethanopterin reductase